MSSLTGIWSKKPVRSVKNGDTGFCPTKLERFLCVIETPAQNPNVDNTVGLGLTDVTLQSKLNP